MLLVPINKDLRFESLGKGWSQVKEHAKGTPLLISIWSVWALINSVLEPLQTSDSFDESDDNSFEKPQNQ